MDEREAWDRQAQHPLQSFEWGEFRKLTGVDIVRENGLQITIHRVPYTPWTVGYCPKTPLPNASQIETLKKIAKEHNCLFIKLEPKVEGVWSPPPGFVPGRALFTKYNFVLDVSPSEEVLMSNLKQKTRYNIRMAEKKGVTIELDHSPEAFNRYIELTEETTKRQGFYAHSTKYHRDMWKVLGNNQASNSNNQLTAHLLVAKYQGEIITTWILFKFADTLYYPYGASTRAHREVMANNLVMWEAIKLAKKWGCKYLDMWGALGSEPDIKDPWYGFHTFKLGYGGRHVEYIGTWDYVARPTLYKVYKLVELIRWRLLKLIK